MQRSGPRDPGAAERQARRRDRRRAALVWDPQSGEMVRPDPHQPSAHSYQLTRCGHCRPAHTEAARNQRIGKRYGDLETTALSLATLKTFDLTTLAARHLDGRVSRATVPPPPPAGRGRHRRNP